MLRILTALAVLIVVAPATAEPADETVVSQQQSPPQQAPKRDCERHQGEGVS